MREQMKRAMIFGVALILAAPMVESMSVSEAQAGPGSILGGSRSGGKRTHKQSSKKSSSKKSSSKKKSSSSSSSSSSSRTTTRNSSPTHRSTTTTTTSRGRVYSRPSSTTTTTTTRRRADDRRVVRCTSGGRCDNTPVAVGQPTRRPVTTTTTTRTTTRSTPVHRRTTYRSAPSTTHHHHHHGSGPVRSTTYVNRSTQVNYYNNTNTRYYGSRGTGGGATVSSSNSNGGGSTTNARSGRRPSSEFYLTGGMGLSGMAANQITDAPMPGIDFTVAAGGKRRFVVGEVGLGLSGYRLDPAMAVNTADMTLVSVTGDLKLQPSLAFIEPYISAGIGGHVFNDHIINAGAAGASFRLGAGLDLRFNNVAVSAQYQRNFMALVGNDQVYEGGSLKAQTETLGVGLKLYF